MKKTITITVPDEFVAEVQARGVVVFEEDVLNSIS